MFIKKISHALTWQEYLVAYNLLYTNDGQVQYEEEKFAQEYPNQEILLLRKEAFLSLSKDAKEVVKIMIDAPTELLCDIYDKISKQKIVVYLMHKRKWPKRKVKKVFCELKLYIEEEI